MFSNQNRDASEVKEVPSLISRPALPAQFRHAAVLADGTHLIGIPLYSERNVIQIWDIKAQEFRWDTAFLWHITSITLLKNNEVVIVTDTSHIHYFAIDMENKKLVHKANGIFKANKNISCMTLLQNELLAIGHDDGSISFWDLIHRNETKTFSKGSSKVTAMNTLQDGSLLVGRVNGGIFIYNLKEESCALRHFSTIPILSLVTLPDNTIAFSDSNGYLSHWDLTTKERLSYQKISDGGFNLIAMPNGWIGCLTTHSLQLFEPAWVRDCVTVSKAKSILETYLPRPVVEIISGYASVGTLFNSPKMPHKKECILEETISPKHQM